MKVYMKGNMKKERLGKQKKRFHSGDLLQKYLMIVLLLVIFVSGSYLMINNTVKNLVRQGTETSNTKILNQINAKTTEFHNAMHNILTLIAYDSTAYRYFEKKSPQEIEDYEGLISLLSNTMMAQNEIAGIALYDGAMEKMIGVGKDYELFTKVTAVKKLQYSNVFRPNSSSTTYFTVSYPVYDIMNENYDVQLGAIVILMKASKFASYLTGSAITEHERLYLVDDNNVIIASDKGTEFTKLNLTSAFTAQKYIETVEQKETGWKIVSIIPEAELYSGMHLVRSAIFIIYLITFMGFVILLCFCYFLILRPIRKVDTFIQKSVTHPVNRLKMTGKDEISVLARNLDHMLDEKNEMSEKLRLSQRELYEIELARQQMQVLAYRNQINPHFLYNTFECIRAMALYYEADEIGEITIALSDIFRYAVKGANIVTVEEEIKYIEEYAKITHYRFGEKIRVIIHAEEAASKKKIIKLLLQPLVENSIVHGLEQKVENGTVEVLVHCVEPDKLRITVQDDGCGMDKSTLEDMLRYIRKKSLNSSSNKNGIGLTNIYQRLRLFYGDQADFQIESTRGCGTKVHITIPEDTKKGEERSGAADI